MTVLLFEPHQRRDDGVLFASYTILRENALIVTVLGADHIRTQESEDAAHVLGTQCLPFDFTENPDWDKVGYRMEKIDGTRMEVETVWAPLIETYGGHRHHDEVGRLA